MNMTKIQTQSGMSHLVVNFKTELCLKSKMTEMCAGFSSKSQSLTATSAPAFICIQNDLQRHSGQNGYIPISQMAQQTPFHKQGALKMKILPRDIDRSKEVSSQSVMEGSKVYLVNALTEEYLTCASTGEVKFDKESRVSKDLNRHLYQASTWTVQFCRNLATMAQSGLEPITIYDEVCFKSVHSTYLTVRGSALELAAESEFDKQRSVWNLIKANEPHYPEWVFKKGSFNQFNQQNTKKSVKANDMRMIAKRKNLGEFPSETQEALLIEDILDVMLGFEGAFIKRRAERIEFVIEPQLERPSCSVAMSQLTYKILALPQLYYRIERYIGENSLQEGMVCQAMCGGLRSLVKEYKMMVVQFEDKAREGLTLQMLWCVCQTSLKVMEALATLVEEAGRSKGGQLITCLWSLLSENTDKQVVGIYKFLFKGVMRVYTQMVSKWIYEGSVVDKHQEFMIQEETARGAGEWNYFEERFLIRSEQVPCIFAKQSQDMLVTGKYLNILRHCNRLSDHPLKDELTNAFESPNQELDFTDAVRKAYEWANQEMLRLTFEHCKLSQVLKSVKGYYFLEFGDLFVHFMEAAESDLLIPRKRIQNGKQFSEHKMRSLFELLLRTSSANGDPFKEEVSCAVENCSLYEQIHRVKSLEAEELGFSCSEKAFIKSESRYLDFLTLDYGCEFPLTLILNRRSLAKYQALFRLIFWCKFTEKRLNAVWLSLQSTKELPVPAYSSAYLLNQRMIAFVKNFVYYLCYEVVEENWIAFQDALSRVSTFQDIVDCHDRFLNACLNQSLITNSKLLAIVTSEIGKACEGFVSIKELLDFVLENYKFEPKGVPGKEGACKVADQRRQYVRKFKDSIREFLDEARFLRVIQEFGTNFDDSMRKLLREIYSMIGKEDTHLVNLINRLDEEKYYNKRLFAEQSREFTI